MALVVYQGPNNIETYNNEIDDRKAFVGLSNQGATCYLNGLLQTLFMTPEFRKAIFTWRYDKQKDGDEELCIPLQLQRLFGLLQLSSNKSVDTIGLTKSFGWNSSDVFQQQDVQELCRVLFDALEESFKGTEVENIIDILYAGELIDYIQCVDVDYQSERNDKFLDFSLAIVPFGSDKAMRSLTECIEMFLRPELLDGDNKYYAEQFNQKVDAIKGLKFGKLPLIMSVQLKRFVYDFTGPNIVQKKLNDIVKFPMILDMNKYVARKCSESGGTEPNIEFDEFLREQLELLNKEKNKIVEENDFVPIVTSNPFDDDYPSCYGAAYEDSYNNNNNNNAEEPVDLVCYNSISTDEVIHLIDTRGEWIYELYAVLIHSGAISGGHYFAYVKDLDSKKWYNFNDSNVTLIDESVVQESWGGQVQTHTVNYGPYYGTSLYNNNNSFYKPLTNYNNFNSSNAYMLMYRKVSKENYSVVAFPYDEMIPDYIKEIVKNEEERKRIRLAEEEEYRNKLSIKVFCNNKDHSIATSRTTTYQDFITIILNRFNICDEDNNNITFDLIRLRNYHSYTKVKSDVIDFEENKHKTLHELQFSDYKQYFLECRSRKDEEWEQYFTDGITILVDEFDRVEFKFKQTQSLRIKQNMTLGELKLTFSKWVSYEADKIQVLKISNIGIYDAKKEILVDDEKKICDFPFISDGCKLFFEHINESVSSGLDGSMINNENVENDISFAFEAYLSDRNRLRININKPPSFESTQFVMIDGRCTIAELREAIGNRLELDPEEIRLFKGQINGTEIKDSKQTLLDANLFSGIGVHVSIGKATPAGFFNVQFVIYKPIDHSSNIVPFPEISNANDVVDLSNWGSNNENWGTDNSYISQQSTTANHIKMDYPNFSQTETDSVYTPPKVTSSDILNDFDPALYDFEDDDSIPDLIESSSNTNVIPYYNSAHIPYNNSADNDIDNISNEGVVDNNETFSTNGGDDNDFENSYDDTNYYYNHNSGSGIPAPIEATAIISDSKASTSYTYNLPYAVASEVASAESTVSSHLDKNETTSGIADSRYDLIEPSDFGEKMIKNSSHLTQFDPIEDINSFYVNQSTLISEVRQKLFDLLILSGKIPIGTLVNQIRLRDKIGTNPGKLLDISKTIVQNGAYLYDNKTFIIEITEQEENLEPDDGGNTLLLVQRWVRSTWTLGPRFEVYLNGSMSICDIVRGLCILTGINPLSVLLMIIPKDTEINLSDLNQDSPMKNYGRSWYNPMREYRPLKFTSHEMRVQDGDLLLLQDSSEPLKELTPADLKSIEIVALASTPAEYNEWSSSYVCYPANSNSKVTFNDNNTHSHTYINNIPTTTALNTSASSTGIRITTHRERERLRENNSVEDNNNSNNIVDDSSIKQLDDNKYSIDATEAEFNKQGGFAIFDDII